MLRPVYTTLDIYVFSNMQQQPHYPPMHAMKVTITLKTTPHNCIDINCWWSSVMMWSSYQRDKGMFKQDLGTYNCYNMTDSSISITHTSSNKDSIIIYACIHGMDTATPAWFNWKTGKLRILDITPDKVLWLVLVYGTMVRGQTHVRIKG